MIRKLGFLGVLLPMAALAGGDDAPLRLNDVQVIGSHNSYRRLPPAAMLAHLDAERPGSARALSYEHPPLARQLDLGVRQLELDIFADPVGGRFADPPGERIAPMAIDRAALRQPGFKVMHVPGLDYRAQCAAFVGCLRQIRAWSRAHPRHLPIFITIDAKDQAFSNPDAIVPLPLTADLLDALDGEIRSVFPPGAIITPDDVRGRHATLREAVLANDWPMLDAARGRVMVIFDVRRETADRYRAGHPSLAKRAMFSLYDDDQPEAATIIVQNPRGRQADIGARVRQGFIVRTRSDADTKEARAGDRGGMEAAATSGAQMISSDYYPGAPDPGHFGFTLALPGGVMQRCNPVRRPAICALGAEE